MVALICILSGLGWFWLRDRTASFARGCLLLPLLLYFFLVSPVGLTLAEKGLTAWIPHDSGQRADAIVVLGRGRSQRADRVQQAAQLWQAERAPLVFASGQIDAPAIAQTLQRQGVSADSIAFEGCSRTTEENAQITAAMLSPQGIQSIILVTDPTHMVRARLTFQSLGFRVWPHLSNQNDPDAKTTTFVRNVREYVGLVTYALRGRYRPRSVEPVYRQAVV